MKFAHPLTLLATVALTIPSTLADFHIIQGTSLQACPSSYYNCKCMRDSDRAAQVILNGQRPWSLPDSFFSVTAGLCGMGQLNFYKRSDGNWDFYVNNGDGTLQGRCYSNSASTQCTSQSQPGGILFNDQLVCYSYICGN